MGLFRLAGVAVPQIVSTLYSEQGAVVLSQAAEGLSPHAMYKRDLARQGHTPKSALDGYNDRLDQDTKHVIIMIDSMAGNSDRHKGNFLIQEKPSGGGGWGVVPVDNDNMFTFHAARSGLRGPLQGAWESISEAVVSRMRPLLDVTNARLRAVLGTLPADVQVAYARNAGIMKRVLAAGERNIRRIDVALGVTYTDDTLDRLLATRGTATRLAGAVDKSWLRFVGRLATSFEASTRAHSSSSWRKAATTWLRQLETATSVGKCPWKEEIPALVQTVDHTLGSSIMLNLALDMLQDMKGLVSANSSEPVWMKELSARLKSLAANHDA